jgi:hypothetical protein
MSPAGLSVTFGLIQVGVVAGEPIKGIADFGPCALGMAAGRRSNPLTAPSGRFRRKAVPSVGSFRRLARKQFRHTHARGVQWVDPPYVGEVAQPSVKSSGVKLIERLHHSNAFSCR